MCREGFQDNVQIAVAPIIFLHIKRITSTAPGWPHQLSLASHCCLNSGTNNKPSTGYRADVPLTSCKYQIFLKDRRRLQSLANDDPSFVTEREGKDESMILKHSKL